MSTGLETTMKMPLKPESMTLWTTSRTTCRLGLSISSRSLESLGMGAAAVMTTMSASVQSL